jgi:hypothetical protein
MIGECPKKEKDRPKPTIEEPDPVTWYRFALLADRLGFNSQVIRQLKADDPYKTEARNYLLKHNPPEFYTFDQRLFEDCVEQMARTRAAVVEKDRQYVRPPLVVDGPGESLSRRCGRFFQTAHEYDRNYLFLEVLYDTDNSRGKGITSFFVRRSVYFAFFGRSVPSGKAEAPGGRPPPSSPSGNMDWESGRGEERSPNNVDSRPADPSAPKRPRIERQISPLRSSQEQRALVPIEHPLTLQAGENVCLHPHHPVYPFWKAENNTGYHASWR